MLEQIRRWWALRTYRKQLGPLLRRRYGRERTYTVPQVLTTIRVHGLSVSYAPYACAMFCGKKRYSAFVAGGSDWLPGFAALTPGLPLWADDIPVSWPPHADLVVDLNQSFGGSSFEVASDHAPDLSSHAGADFDGGGDGHDGGGAGEGYGGGDGGDGGSSP